MLKHVLHHLKIRVQLLLFSSGVLEWSQSSVFQGYSGILPVYLRKTPVCHFVKGKKEVLDSAIKTANIFKSSNLQISKS